MPAANHPSKADKTKIDQYVEMFSQKGCTTVTSIIATMERGETIAEMGDLSAEERQAILVELKSIMAVYLARK